MFCKRVQKWGTPRLGLSSILADWRSGKDCFEPRCPCGPG